MAWTKSSKNGRLVASESVTLANAGTANGTSIDFIKANKDFSVFINTGATNTVGAVTTDLEGSFDGSTWVDINASFAADCDTAVKMVTYDASTTGDFPYYRLSFDSAADDSATSIVVKVVTTV